ncbi:MAG TPA: hypothetical protein VGN85_05275, partial [Methyloceanibacter sp.]|nr:hypothetical protein [Methyloceanibacter sp.]
AVVAGVLSGRATINYVLARDAREAALSWAAEIDKRLGEQASPSPATRQGPASCRRGEAQCGRR